MRRPTVVGFVAPVVEESAGAGLDLNEAAGLTDFGRFGRYVLSVEGFVPGALSLGAGDLIVVDRNRQPCRGDLVVAERDGVLVMVSADEAEDAFGVVTHVLVSARVKAATPQRHQREQGLPPRHRGGQGQPSVRRTE
ncbi:MAG: hypothetical protein AAGI52_08095 [Bacteroidota bacterium]